MSHGGTKPKIYHFELINKISFVALICYAPICTLNDSYTPNSVAFS